MSPLSCMEVWKFLNKDINFHRHVLYFAAMRFLVQRAYVLRWRSHMAINTCLSTQPIVDLLVVA